MGEGPWGGCRPLNASTPLPSSHLSFSGLHRAPPAQHAAPSRAGMRTSVMGVSLTRSGPYFCNSVLVICGTEIAAQVSSIGCARWLPACAQVGPPCAPCRRPGTLQPARTDQGDKRRFSNQLLLDIRAAGPFPKDSTHLLAQHIDLLVPRELLVQSRVQGIAHGHLRHIGTGDSAPGCLEGAIGGHAFCALCATSVGPVDMDRKLPAPPSCLR